MRIYWVPVIRTRVRSQAVGVDPLHSQVFHLRSGLRIVDVTEVLLGRLLEVLFDPQGRLPDSQ
ncbi:MAG: hypothetical protein P8179_11075 [Candidatus Thiodiazotropha sp.]|jgi:hypothetical protein